MLKDLKANNNILLKTLKSRRSDKSEIMRLNGNHLTPVSVGLREKLLKTNSQNASKYEKIDQIVERTTNWDI